MTVQGGGILKIETQGRGTNLEGETFVVESGGIIEVDKLMLIANSLTIEDSAKISADQKVTFIFCISNYCHFHVISCFVNIISKGINLQIFAIRNFCHLCF